MITKKKKKFSKYLTRGWNTNSSRPVVIHVGHLVRQLLQVIGLHPAVMDHDEMGGRDSTLGNKL